MSSTSRQISSEVSTPRVWGELAPTDWQSATLPAGQSVGGMLRAHGLPLNRHVLAAVAQANGISDFRRLPAGAVLWIPTPELLTGARADAWQASRGVIAADALAVVDADRAPRAVLAAPLTSTTPQAQTPRTASAVSAQGPQPASAPASRPTAPASTPGNRLAAARASAPSAASQQRMNGLATELARQLHGSKNRDEILRLTYALMSDRAWTNADARLAYARVAGAPNDPWKIIRDIRAAQGITVSGNGFSRRDGLRASEYVFNDESTAYDAQVSPAMRAVFAAIGYRDRGMFRLDAAFGTAEASLEDALWDIVNTIGVDQANAIIWSRAGMPGGIVANLKSSDGPVDGHLERPAAGKNPLQNLLEAEYGNVATRAMMGFSSIDKARLEAILRQPQGMDRQSFDLALQANSAKGEDFLKLFHNRTVEQVERIAIAYQATYGKSLVTRATGVLNDAQFQRFMLLQRGTKSDPVAAQRYVAQSLPAVPKERQPEIAKLSPNPFVRRSGEGANDPAALATRIMTSNDPAEVAGCLRRTDGLPWSAAELAVMNRVAAQFTNTSPDAKPSALFEHVAKITGSGSPSSVAVAVVGSTPTNAPLYDSDGRLSPAAQLYYALVTKDDDEVATILAGSTVIDLSTIERDYPRVARELSARGVPAPGGATTAKAAIRAVMRGDERTRALAFMSGIDLTSLASSNATGSAIAAAVTKDLNARCAWLLREFDHEREPLRERLMQFEVTLGQVLTQVQERRDAQGQAVELTEDEQVALGNAVHALVGQETAFASERDAITSRAQDTTILLATLVASTCLTVGSAGFGAPAGAALMTAATNITRVAAVGAAAGLVTAPLQGGNHPYITSVARGAGWGAFTGLGASTSAMHALLGKIMPGVGVVAVTGRNVVIMGTTWGGLAGVRDIGKTYDSPEEMRAAVTRDVLHGAAFGAGFALTMGVAAGLNQYGNGGAVASTAAPAAEAVAAPAATGASSASQAASRLQSEAARLASRPVPAADATQFYQRLARLSEMDATVANMARQGVSADVLQQTSATIAASRSTLDGALAGRVRDIFTAAQTQATPAEAAAALQQFRTAFVDQGFGSAAPQTMRELEAIASRLR